MYHKMQANCIDILNRCSTDSSYFNMNAYTTAKCIQNHLHKPPTRDLLLVDRVC